MFVRSRHSCIGAGTENTSIQTQTTTPYTCTAILSVHVYISIDSVHLYSVTTVFICLFTGEYLIQRVIKNVNFNVISIIYMKLFKKVCWFWLFPNDMTWFYDDFSQNMTYKVLLSMPISIFVLFVCCCFFYFVWRQSIANT